MAAPGEPFGHQAGKANQGILSVGKTKWLRLRGPNSADLSANSGRSWCKNGQGDVEWEEASPWSRTLCSHLQDLNRELRTCAACHFTEVTEPARLRQFIDAILEKVLVNATFR